MTKTKKVSKATAAKLQVAQLSAQIENYKELTQSLGDRLLHAHRDVHNLECQVAHQAEQIGHQRRVIGMALGELKQAGQTVAEQQGQIQEIANEANALRQALTQQNEAGEHVKGLIVALLQTTKAVASVMGVNLEALEAV